MINKKGSRKAGLTPEEQDFLYNYDVKVGNQPKGGRGPLLLPENFYNDMKKFLPEEPPPPLNTPPYTNPLPVAPVPYANIPETESPLDLAGLIQQPITNIPKPEPTVLESREWFTDTKAPTPTYVKTPKVENKPLYPGGTLEKYDTYLERQPWYKKILMPRSYEQGLEEGSERTNFDRILPDVVTPAMKIANTAGRLRPYGDENADIFDMAYERGIEDRESELYQKKGWWGQKAQDLSSAIGSTTTGMLIGGPVGAATVSANLTVMGVTAAGNYMYQAEKEGATPEDAAVYGIIMGTAEALTEKMFGFIPGGKFFEDMPLLSTEYKKSLKELGKWGLKRASGEAVEEVVMEPIGEISRRITYKPDPEWIGYWRDGKLGEGGLFNVKDMTEAGVYGFIIGGMFSATGVVSQIPTAQHIAQNIQNDLLVASNMPDGHASKEMAQAIVTNPDAIDPEMYQDFVNQLDKDIQTENVIRTGETPLEEMPIETEETKEISEDLAKLQAPQKYTLYGQEFELTFEERQKVIDLRRSEYKKIVASGTSKTDAQPIADEIARKYAQEIVDGRTQPVKKIQDYYNPLTKAEKQALKQPKQPATREYTEADLKRAKELLGEQPIPKTEGPKIVKPFVPERIQKQPVLEKSKIEDVKDPQLTYKIKRAIESTAFEKAMTKMGYDTLEDKDRNKTNKKVSKPMFTHQGEEFRYWEEKYKNKLLNDKKFIENIKNKYYEEIEANKRAKIVNDSYGKEDWQVPKDIYIERSALPEKLVAESHKRVIEKALKEGKVIPEEVLRDYPELAKVTKKSNTFKEFKKYLSSPGGREELISDTKQKGYDRAKEILVSDYIADNPELEDEREKLNSIVDETFPELVGKVKDVFPDEYDDDLVTKKPDVLVEEPKPAVSEPKKDTTKKKPVTKMKSGYVEHVFMDSATGQPYKIKVLGSTYGNLAASPTVTGGHAKGTPQDKIKTDSKRIQILHAPSGLYAGKTFTNKINAQRFIRYIVDNVEIPDTEMAFAEMFRDENFKKWYDASFDYFNAGNQTLGLTEYLRQVESKQLKPEELLDLLDYKGLTVHGYSYDQRQKIARELITQLGEESEPLTKEQKYELEKEIERLKIRRNKMSDTKYETKAKKERVIADIDSDIRAQQATLAKNNTREYLKVDYSRVGKLEVRNNAEAVAEIFKKLSIKIADQTKPPVLEREPKTLEPPKVEPEPTAGYSKEVQDEFNNAFKYMKNFNINMGTSILVDAKTPFQMGLADMMKALGTKVVFFEGEGVVGGWYSKELDKTIFVNTRRGETSDAKSHLVFTVGHEAWHSFKHSYPDLTQELTEYMISTVSDKNLATYTSMLTGGKTYTDNLTKEMVVDEMVADAFGEKFTDKTFWEGLEKKNRTLFQKLSDIVKNLFSSLKKYYSGNLLTSEQIKRANIAFTDIVEKIVADTAGVKLGVKSEVKGEKLEEKIEEKVEVAKPKVTKPKTEIKDFGEKIGGARKDTWANKAMVIEDLNNMTDREAAKYVTKDNIWPKIDYEKLIEDGMHKTTAYFVKLVRDSLPAKIPIVASPEENRAYREAYITYIGQVRDAVSKVKDMGDIKNLFDNIYVANGYYVKPTTQYGMGEWKGDMKVRHFIENKTIAAMRPSVYDVSRAESKIEKTGWPAKQELWKKDIVIAENTKTGLWEIRKSYKILVDGFADKVEAETYLENTLRPTLVKAVEKPEVPNIPQLKSIKRDGIDYRNGKDITPEKFLADFGFRGGEFGNWNNQAERQASLNYAYDAFRDLAAVLELDPINMSLNGELGIAFGARGHGGKDAAVAHYEPSKVVINLTKIKGAGSLAHEWYHALDDYLGRISGDKSSAMPYVTTGVTKNTKLAPNIVELLKNLTNTMYERPMTKEEYFDSTKERITSYEKKLDLALDNAEKTLLRGGTRWVYDRKLKERVEQPIPMATDKQLQDFKDARKILDLEKIAKIYKEVREKDMDAEEFKWMGMYKEWANDSRQELTEEAFNSKKRTKITNYVTEAKNIDTIFNPNKKYWAEDVELAARAFGAYVQDKLGTKKSDYLVHSHKNGFSDMFKPYPEGGERGVINMRFGELFKALRKDAAIMKLSDSDIKYSVSKQSPIFYSKMQQVITDKMSKTSDWKTVMGIVNSGAKKEEIYWSGIEQYLKDKVKVDKQELLDWLKANEIKIKEIASYGSDNEVQYSWVINEYREDSQFFKTEEEMLDALEDVKRKYRDAYTIDSEEGKYLKVIWPEDYSSVHYKYYADQETDYGLDPSGYYLVSDYASFARNYYKTWEELVEGAEESIDYWVKSAFESSVTYGREEPGGENYDTSGRYEDETLREGDYTDYQTVLLQLEDAPAVPGRDTYRHSHWESSNILAHARFDTRIDKDGKKVLFIEEIQSDWHQKGLEEGYRDTEDFRKIAKEVEALGLAMSSTSGATIRAAGGSEELANRFMSTFISGPSTSAVPDAPFKATWHELALKRLIKYAADNNFDKMAWTTGEQQSQRYNLSKDVDNIHVAATDTPDRYRLIAYKDGVKVFSDMDIDSIKKLKKYVGADITKKVLAGQEEFKGDDLKIGGHGMRVFYDQKLKNFLDKYVKQWDKDNGVGVVELPTYELGTRRYEGTKLDIEQLEKLKDKELLQAQSFKFWEENKFKTDLDILEYEEYLLDEVNALIYDIEDVGLEVAYNRLESELKNNNSFARKSDFIHYLGAKVRFDEVVLTQQGIDITPNMKKSLPENGQPLFSVDKVWPANFPKMEIMINLSRFKDKTNGNYELWYKAKRGDVRAAVTLIDKVIKTDKIRELGKQYPDAILVPVHAEEVAGRNVLPLAFASRIARITGQEIDNDIVQSNRAHRTDKSKLERLIQKVAFDGEVKSGYNYIIIDDVVTQGGTIKGLRNHILENGGNVVAVVAIAPGYAAPLQLSLTPETKNKLEVKFDGQINNLLNEYGIAKDVGELTEAEGRSLLRQVRNANDFRNKITKTAQADNPRTDGENVSFSVDKYEGLAKEGAEQRYGDAYVRNQTLFDKLIAALKHTKTSFERGRFDKLERGSVYSEVREKLQALLKSRNIALGLTIEDMSYVLKDLKTEEFDIFVRKVIFDDLLETAKEGKAVPYGYETAEEIQAELDLLEPHLTTAIRGALFDRAIMWNKLKREYTDAMHSVGFKVEDRLTRKNYYRHVVIDYYNVKYGGANLGQKLKTPTGASFLKQRSGSQLDISRDYLVVEGEVMVQMRNDIEKAKMIKYLDSSEHNILDELKAQAKSENKSNFNAIIESELADPKAPVDELGRPISETELVVKKYNQLLAMSFSRLATFAQRGELWGKHEYPDVHRALRSRNNTDVDTDNVNRMYEYLGELSKQGNAELGVREARTVLKYTSLKREFIKQKLGKKYKTWENLIPSTHIDWQPRKGNAMYAVYSIPDRLAQDLINELLTTLNINKSQLKKETVVGKEYKSLVLPKELVATLESLIPPNNQEGIEKILRGSIRYWKVYQLLSPRRYLKYNIRNLSGDADHVFFGNPKGFIKVPQAVIELRDVMYKNKQMDGDILAFFERGGMQSFLQVQEMGDINRLKMFADKFTADKRLSTLPLRIIQGYWRGVRLSTDYREAILRYANFLSFKEQILAGTLRNYGGSIKSEVDAIKNVDDKAYKLANELLGAYDDVSLQGQYLADRVAYFYRFVETNARFYIRAFRNTMNDTGFMAAVGRSTLLGGKKLGFGLAVNLGKAVFGAFALTVLFDLWNTLLFKDDEDKLPESIKSRSHIMLGRTPDGRIMYFSRLGALSEFLEWFGLGNVLGDIRDLISGRRTIKEKTTEALKSPVNKAVGMSFPILKTAGEAAAGVTFFPDVFERKTIRDRGQYLARSFALGPEYDLLNKIPSKGYVGSFLELFVYTIDEREAAYNDIISEKYRFLENNKLETGAGKTLTYSDKSNALYNYKKAIKYGDRDLADYWIGRYAELGGTRKGLKISLASLSPAYQVPKGRWGEFVRSLNSEDRDKLRQAVEYYNDVISGRMMSEDEEGED
jgi:hypoxanthine-guanine phosphoribosyltransferase